MKLQHDIVIFHLSITSPASFRLIGWLFNTVGGVIIFDSSNKLIFTAKQVEAWWKSNFMAPVQIYDDFLISFHQIIAYF